MLPSAAAMSAALALDPPDTHGDKELKELKKKKKKPSPIFPQLPVK